MSQLSIGIIEVIGLSSAIELADVCVKSANVNLIGYELSQGNGMVVVKIEGDVGSVNAAIQASSNVGRVYSKKVIPRPGDGIECLIKNINTVGYEDKNKNTDDDTDVLIIKEEKEVKEEKENETKEVKEEKENETKEEIEEKEVIEEENNEIKEETKEKEVIEEKENETKEEIKENEIIEEENNLNEDDSNEKYTCNLCKDPKCPREKGDLRVNCIHYDDKGTNS